MNRRDLLRTLAMLGGMTLTCERTLLHAAAGRTGRRIILLELSGANDGLNTLVPYTDERYFALRPSIAITDSGRIALDHEFAVHAAMQKMMPLWEAGELAFVHGLGYPHPNRSHFKSMALWESGGDGRQSRYSGWMTHDIEHAYHQNSVEAHGISLGGNFGIFDSNGGNWISMASANQFNDLQHDAVPEPGQADIGNVRPASIDAESASRLTAAEQARHALISRAALLSRSVSGISAKVAASQHAVNLGSESLAQQMSHAVRLILAGVRAPVLKVSLDGFDTHENQSARHASQLRKVAYAIDGLYRALRASGEWDNTLLVTYSEFGRRAGENRSGGTDHGTAAPHIIAGGYANGGLFGDMPDLGNLANGDLQYTMDYRAVYSKLLTDWLQLPTDRFSKYNDKRLNHLFS